MTRWAARAASVLAVIVGLATALPADAQEAPSAALDRGIAAPGDAVEIIGRAWPAGIVVQAQLCGNEALNGSIDCDRSAALTVGIGSDGRFGMLLPVTVPPAPCPCVVLLTSPDLAASALRLPLDVTGAPTAEPVQDLASVPIFSITKLNVTGGGFPGSFFGLSHDRSVVMTVENLGSLTIDELPITLADSDEPDKIIATGSLTGLEPGEKTVVRVPFTVPMLARGTTTINVTVDQSGQAIASTTSFSTFPWGLVLAAVVALTVAVMAWVMRRRRTPPPFELLPVDRPGLPAPAGEPLELMRAPFALAAAPSFVTDETIAPVRNGATEPSGTPVSAREPIALLAVSPKDDEATVEPAVTGAAEQPTVEPAGDHDQTDELARLITEALREMGPMPPPSETDHLAEQMAIIIVSEFRGHHELGLSGEVALTASIGDELARELRQLAGAS